MITAADVKARAKALGFDLCGIAPVGAFPELGFFREWLDRGYSGTMAYLPRSASKRTDVRRILPNAQSVIMTGTFYDSAGSSSDTSHDPARADVARYARGEDYHLVLGKRLDALLEWMRQAHGEPFDALPYVDTGPVQGRVYAQYAGLGWIGKNTCVVNAEHGSWMLLAEIVCSLPLDTDQPALDQCGTCTLCLEACPTDAFKGPYVLDATRCISYLTIEYRGTIPAELYDAIGNRLFGCDVCQEVCPFNAMAATANAQWPVRQGLNLARLAELAELSDAELEARIEGTPLTRGGVERLRRNLAVSRRNAP